MWVRVKSEMCIAMKKKLSKCIPEFLKLAFSSSAMEFSTLLAPDLFVCDFA